MPVTAGIVLHLKFLYNADYAMTGEVDKLLFEYDCAGKAVFQSSGQTFSADFSLRQLRDGTIAGAVTLLGMAEGVALTILASSPGDFDLDGFDKAHGFAIRVEGCHFTHMVSGANALQGEFIAFRAFVKLDALETKLVRPAFVAAYVTNMYKTFRVIVQSPLGKMQVAHELDIENLERLMTYQRISLVTSQIQIFAENAVGMSVKDLIEQAEHTVRGFLYVTRLAQTCWHDWCSISIYEKHENDEGMTLRAVKMRLPWKKPPVDRGISVVAHSDFFIKNAYAGYNDQLEVRHGFETALHWYLESNATEVMESKYLLACTCLELLADRHAKTLGTEFILDDNLFGRFYDMIKDVASEWLKKIGVQSDKRALVYDALRGVNRPSFRSKIENLLREWKIRHDDIGLDIGRIVELRNTITHTGISASKDLVDEYDKLYVTLTRLFLSMLGYKHDYYDWVHQKWMKMDDVLAT